MALSGVLWFVVGVILLRKGIGLLFDAGGRMHYEEAGTFPLLTLSVSLVGDIRKGVVVSALSGCIVGMAKGRCVLRKSVRRIVNRIYSLPPSFSYGEIYPKGYYFLLAGMAGMGAVMRVIPLPSDIKGFIDLSVGVALVTGAGLYFVCAAIPPVVERR